MRELKEHWKTTTLGDYIDVQTGYPFKSQGYTNNPTGVRLLRGDNIIQGCLRWEGVKRWPAADDQDYKKYFLATGDVVVAMDRPWIEAGLKFACIGDADLPCLLVQRVARLRGTNGLRTGYLRYLIGHQAFTDYVKGIWTGVAVPHISESQIRAFKISLPPIAVQDRIVSVLSAYDDLIENNTRRIKILEEMAQMIYREWFVNFRFPGHEKTKMVKTEKGYKPAGWNSVPFTEAAQFINGFAFGPEHWRNSGQPIIKIKELKNGITPDTPRYDGEGLDEKYVIHTGDILFSWSADLDAYIWSGEQALLNQHLFRVLAKNGFGRLFIFFSLKNQMQSFRSRSMGTTMRHIKRSALDEVEVTVPDRAVLDEFENLVTPVGSLVTNLSQSNSSLRRMRDLLLPKLISGEVSVEELETEAASQIS